MSIDGHEVANHSTNHPNLKKLTNEEVKEEVSTTNQLILKNARKSALFFRPPYVSHSAEIDKIIDMPIILWTIDPKDWKSRNTDKIINFVTKNAHRNGIILLHDLYKTTIDAVPLIIKKLKEQGYTFVPI